MADITLDGSRLVPGDGVYDYYIPLDYAGDESVDDIRVFAGNQTPFAYSEPGGYVYYQISFDEADTLTIYISEDFTYNVFTGEGYYVNIYSPGEGSMTVGGNQLFTVEVFCFTEGARVETPNGPVPIEDLSPGDLVLTRDRGPQPLRWVGNSLQTAETLAAFPELRPVTLAAGALGDHAETTVSPKHRILVGGWRAEALTGAPEVLAAAESLVDGVRIRRAPAEDVTYYHLLFDAHEIICVDGLWSESFHPAAIGATLAAPTRDEVLELFPMLETDAAPAPARPALSPDAVVFLKL